MRSFIKIKNLKNYLSLDGIGEGDLTQNTHHPANAMIRYGSLSISNPLPQGAREFTCALVIFLTLFISFSSFAQEDSTPAPAPIVLNADKIAAQGADKEPTEKAAQPTASAAAEVEKATPEVVTTDFQSEAKQAILIDFNTDSVLYDKNAEEKMFPSSMTKVLTMYLVFDQLRKNHITMDTEFTISERSWKTGGSQMFLKVGDKVKVSDLIQGVIVQSGNDACIALAEGISGSVESFVEDMNVVAKNIGMNHTHFQNPDGLPTDEHYTTAKDLSIIARRLITDFPEYYHYYSQREFTYNKITQQNRNKLLDIPDLGVDGMKTGFTEMGGYGIIATGVKDGRRLIAVVNGLKTNDERLKSAENLLRYGYNNFKDVKIFNKFENIGKVKIWGGESNFVNISPDKDIEFLINRKDYNFNNYKVFTAYKEPWIAPIKKGDNIAVLVIKDSKDAVIAQFPLYAANDVAEAGIIKKLVQKFKYLLGK